MTDTALRVTFDQDVWWTSADGLTRLVDDLPDGHRANIAGWLVKFAAQFHMVRRYRQLEWGWLSFTSYDGDLDEAPLLTHDEIMAQIRREQALGEHLDWVRSTVLFQRMIRGLDRLPPGTLP